MLARRLTYFQRLNIVRKTKAATDIQDLTRSCAFQRRISGNTSKFGTIYPSTVVRKRSLAGMVGAAAGGVTADEVEALRRQVEDLKVRHVAICISILFFDESMCSTQECEDLG